MSLKVAQVSTRVPAKYRNARGAVNTIIARSHRQASSEGMQILRASIQRTGAIASFTLYNSVRDRLKARASRSDWYTREIYFIQPASRYWWFADRGRSAGTPPPIAPLLAWAVAVGLPRAVAYAIQNIIGEEGTQGHHFLRDALPRIRENARRLMRQARREVVRYFKGRGKG